MSKARRDFVDRARDRFESTGSLALETRMKLREFCVLYTKQMKELHAARERARITNGLRKIGMTRAEAAEIRNRRLEEERELRSDLGI